MSKWYDAIDSKIRDLIFELRNNGINTTCSNGDKGYIEAEWHADSDPGIAYELCRKAGYKLVRIEATWTTFPVPQKYLKIRLYDKKFNNVPATYIPKMYTQIIEPNKRIEIEDESLDLVAQQDGSHEKHESIINFLRPLFPTFIFLSQFDRRLIGTKMPKTEGKQMIYVLNYDMEKDKGFESTTKTYKNSIEFYKLTVEATQKQSSLFKKLGLIEGESDGTDDSNRGTHTNTEAARITKGTESI